MKRAHHQVIGVLFPIALFVGVPLVLVATVSSPQMPTDLLIIRTIIVTPFAAILTIWFGPNSYRWITGDWGWQIPTIPILPEIPPSPPPEFNPAGVPRSPTGPSPLVAHAVPETEEDGQTELLVRL